MENEKEDAMSSGLALGMSLGLIIGILMDNIAWELLSALLLEWLWELYLEKYDLIIVVSRKSLNPDKISIITVHQQEAKRRRGNNARR